MFKSIGDYLDTALDIGADAINGLKPDQSDWNKQVADTAREAASHDAASDWSEGNVNTVALQFTPVDFPQPSQRDVQFDDALNAAIAAEPLRAPSFDKSWMTGIEVALTPTTANLGENELFEGRETYNASYQDAYREEIGHQFDQKLEARFEPDPSAWRDATLPSSYEGSSSLPSIDYSSSSPSDSSGVSSSDSGSSDTSSSSND